MPGRDVLVSCGAHLATDVPKGFQVTADMLPQLPFCAKGRNSTKPAKSTGT